MNAKIPPKASKRVVDQPVIGQPLRIWEGEDCSFVKPGELIEIRGHANLTLQDRRTFNMLMTNAWPRITENVEHSIRKSLLRGEHRSNERLSDTIDRLMKTIVVLKVVRDGKPSDLKVQLLGPTVENRDDTGNLYYRFLPEMIEVISYSDHWARLQAQVMLALSSKYSQNLYEMVQKRAGLTSKFQQDFSIEEMRDILGVSDGKMMRWPDLRQFCIEPAVQEVAALSQCHVSVDPITHKRLVIGVKMTWFPKDEAGLQETFKEIERHKAGRKARIKGTVETVGQKELGL